MSPVETLLLDVDGRHEPNLGMFDGKPIILGCSCMSVRDYRRAGHHGGFLGHRAHVAAEQAKALMTMLEESGIDRQMQGCLSGFDCAHDDSDACADALAAALADLIGGAR